MLLDGMPDPAGEPAAYERQCVEMIKRYAGRTDGHSFVLLTSYEMMKRVAAGLTRLVGGEQSGAVQSGRRTAAERDDRAVSKPIRAACCWEPTAFGKESTCRETRCKR